MSQSDKSDQPNQSKRYVIIDTDCGIDDALAIMLAADCHKNGLIELLAITCCYGNASINNVVENVCHTLRVCDIQNVSVYKGSSCPIINEHHLDGFYGDDGLGNSTKELPAIDVSIEDEHAVSALSRLAKQFPKQITIMALGPLTNLALTYLIDPQFFDNIEQIILMGGSMIAHGNSRPTSEFNFFNDPEAVHVVLANSRCPLTIIPWETSLKHLITWDVYDQILKIDTEKANFFEKIYRRIYGLMHDDNYGGTRRPGLIVCDILVVVAFVYPELICEVEQYPVLMELHGLLTRGQLVVDRRQRADINKSTPVVKFITLFNQSKFMKLVTKIMK